MEDGCVMCRRIERIEAGEDEYFVAELQTGYVTLESYQFLRGHSVFISKAHAAELHELPMPYRVQFLLEMSQVAEAVHRTFHPMKMNYALLGNLVPHLHWHLIPRHSDDPNPKGAIWEVDRSVWASDKCIPSSEELEGLKQRLLDGMKASNSLEILSTFRG